jgi:hypothetical protein
MSFLLQPLAERQCHAPTRRRGSGDDAGALTDQSLPHPVKRLQVELLGRLRRNELHRRPLHRLGDCLGIAEVVRTYLAGISLAS